MDRRTWFPYLCISLLVIFILGTAIYWVAYFFVGGTQVTSEIWYTRFEDAFPAADAWAVVLSILAVVFLLRRDAANAPFFLAASGAAILFLALMDITFDLENGLYALVGTNAAMQTELGINVFTVLTGVLALYCGWNLRRPLRPGG